MRIRLIVTALVVLIAGASITNAYEPITQGEKKLARDVINGRYDAVAEAIYSDSGTGDDLAILTWEGAPLLVYVAKGGDIKMAKLLIRNGADVNARAKGFPILHYVVNEGHVPMAKLLIRNGAEINAVAQSITALQVARKKGYFELEQILIRYGATGADAYETESEINKEGSEGFWEGGMKQESFTGGFRYGFERGTQGNVPWYFYVFAFAIVAFFAFACWQGAKKRGRNPWIWAGLTAITSLVPLLPLLCWVPYVILRILGAPAKQQSEEIDS